jgi:putative tryptophan/tyrosine transport system substrate-binding protein
VCGWDRGADLLILNASTERDFDAVFANLIQLRAGGLVIAADPLFTAQLDATSALRVPCRRISHFRRSR